MIKTLKYSLYIIIIVFSVMMIFSCEKPVKTPDWEWPDPPPKPKPDPDPEKPAVVLKPRFIWIDANANFPDYANSKENIARDLKKIKETGFTDIVVDVRPPMGDVLFKSSLISEATKLPYWDGPAYKFYTRTATWDYLQAFIDEGHKQGLKVHAAINTFVGGEKYPYGLGQQGLLFREPSKKDWGSTINLSSGLTNIMDINDDDFSCKFLNPAHPEVQTLLIGILKELAAYNVDGIFLDRCRFDYLGADFSKTTRTAFETYIGENVTNFPSDIFAPGTYALPAYMPKHSKSWLEFRVKVIHDFVEKASNAVHSVNPNITFGAYVGGWYSTYYEYGVNWASPEYNTAAYYPKWASANYQKFGYADHLNFLLIGAYASATNIYGTGEWSVQGFCKRAGTVLKGAVKYAGGPDVGNWDTTGCSNIGAAVTSTVDAAINSGDGYFLFDLIHVKIYDYWDELKAGIDKYITAASTTK